MEKVLYDKHIELLEHLIKSLDEGTIKSYLHKIKKKKEIEEYERNFRKVV